MDETAPGKPKAAPAAGRGQEGFRGRRPDVSRETFSYPGGPEATTMPESLAMTRQDPDDDARHVRR
jgi:hypothetical protein